MARRPFGGTTADVAQDVAGDRVAGAQVTVWTAATGGTKLTDLQTPAGVALAGGVVLSDANGIIAFLGPSDGTAVVYVDGGLGGRTKMVATDLADRVGTLESTPGGVASVAGRTGVVVLSKADVGLGNVDNTADASKPVSAAQQAALDLKANLASPALTGTPTAPTPTGGDNSTKLATTAFVAASVGSSVASLTVKDEGSALTTAADTLDFVGAGVTATGTGATKTINIPGGSPVTYPDASAATRVARPFGWYDVRDYGAKCDLRKSLDHASISSGSAALTVTDATFTSADVGKTMWVEGAGAAGADLKTTISAFTDATHVTLAANAGTTVASKVAAWGTNDRAALSGAADACYAAGGGTVFLSGPMLIDGTINAYGGVVTIPSTPVAFASGVRLPTVRLKGVGGQNIDYNEVGNTPPGLVGATIFCPTVGAAGQACINAGSAAGAFRAIHLEVEDISYQAPNNPTLHAVDGYAAMGLVMRNYTAGLVIPMIRQTANTNTDAAGAKWPQANNNAFCRSEGSYLCWGHYNGAWVTEHFQNNGSMLVQNNKVGLAFDANAHGMYLGRVAAQWNDLTMHVRGTNPIRVTASSIDIEHGSGAPFTTSVDLNDPSSYVTGILPWRLSNGQYNLLLNGALKVRMPSLDALPSDTAGIGSFGSSDAVVNTSVFTSVDSISGAGASDITLVAKPGDVIQLSVPVLWGVDNSANSRVDIGTWVSGAVASYVSSGTSTASANGIAGWSSIGNAAYLPIGAPVFYTVRSADMVSGKVTFRVFAKGTPAKTLSIGNNKWYARNLTAAG